MIATLGQAWLPSFIAPALAGAGAIAVSVPIIIHLLARRQRRPEPWAAMRFLMAAYRRHRTRLRLEQLLLLLLRCAIVLVLGLALAGPLLDATGGSALLPQAGRDVVIILDNSLGATAAETDALTRFESKREIADRIVTHLSGADRVAVITTARPAEAVISPPTADRAVVRRRLQQLHAVPAAARLDDALRLALDAMDEDRSEVSASVILLSDLWAGAVPIDEALPRDFEKLGQRASLFALQPGAAMANMQIESLAARQDVVMPDAPGVSPQAAWELTLRRFSTDLTEDSAEVQLFVPRSPVVTRTVRFEPGQQRTTIAINTPLDTEGATAVRAVLSASDATHDAIEHDNARAAIVDVRQQLRVLVVAPDVAIASGDDAGSISPMRWLTIALQPTLETGDWPIELQSLDPGRLDESSLAGSSVAMVLQPDQLTAEQWRTLRDWCGNGGVVWVTAPPAQRSDLWPQHLADTFDLPWSMALEPTEHDPPLALTATDPQPAALARLSADIEDLVRPVRVRASIAIDPATTVAPTDVLLRTQGGAPLMLTGPVGARGRIVLLAAALDETWTNLTTRPLFVPLVHEVLRWSIARTQPARQFELGDRPALGGAFTDASSLTSPTGRTVLLVADEAGTTSVDPSRTAPAALRPIESLNEIGVYQANNERLAVNVEPDAGDTRAVPSEALDDWLGACGTWQWIDPDDPLKAMQAAAAASDLSMPLLWLLLAMVIAEILLARHASHASLRSATASGVASGVKIDAIVPGTRRAAT